MSVKFGIVGIGNMGSAHAKQLAMGEIKNAELTAICDNNPERLKWAEENLPQSVKCYKDFDLFIQDPLIDAVIIATPHYFHTDMAIQSFEHGKHTLVEKPAGVFTKAVKQMNEVAQRHPHLTFGMMFNQRTNPIYKQAKEYIENGELGEIRRTNWIITDWYRPDAYYRSGGWRATYKGEGGGILMNQDPHQLDLWQWICGMPKTVHAFCFFGKHRDIEVENDVTAFVEYENGATGVFITSTFDYPGTNRFEIVGDNGQLIIEHNQLTFHKNKRPESEFNRINQEPWHQPGYETFEYKIGNEWGGQHNVILQNFVDHILFQTPLIAKGEEGIFGLTLANAMVLSTFLNQTIVLDQLDEERYYEEIMKRCEGDTK